MECEHRKEARRIFAFDLNHDELRIDLGDNILLIKKNLNMKQVDSACKGIFGNTAHHMVGYVRSL
jgi:hypothetical protein